MTTLGKRTNSRVHHNAMLAATLQKTSSKSSHVAMFRSRLTGTPSSMDKQEVNDLQFGCSNARCRANVRRMRQDRSEGCLFQARWPFTEYRLESIVHRTVTDIPHEPLRVATLVHMGTSSHAPIASSRTLLPTSTTTNVMSTTRALELAFIINPLNCS